MNSQTLIYLGVIAALGYGAFYVGHRKGAGIAAQAFSDAAAEAPLPQRQASSSSLTAYGSISGSNTGEGGVF